MRSFLILLACVVTSTLQGAAAHWPGWRGPEGSGVSAEKKLPLRWSTNKNIRWRVPLPDRGNSTPIVWGERVFITQAIEKDNLRTVMCFSRREGKLLWQKGPTWTEKEPSYEDNPPCSPSPVTDGRRVIAWFGSSGIFCYDFDGREVWRRDLGRQTHEWGYASSPILYRDLCILSFGPGQKSFLIALDKKTGRTVWQFDLPPIGPEAKWEEFGGEKEYNDRPGAMKVTDVAGSWATPLLVPVTGGDEVVVAFPLRLMAFAPRTGERLWSCDGPNIGAYSSPFFGDGIVALSACGLRNIVMAVRPGGRGNVTETQRLWLQPRGNSKACIGSGVIFQGHIYQANTTGFAECLDLKTGQVVWEERLAGPGARQALWSSPVLSGDRLYLANRSADVFVLRAGPKFECLATNSIGGEAMNASLAVSHGAIFIRTEKALWCIAETRK